MQVHLICIPLLLCISAKFVRFLGNSPYICVWFMTLVEIRQQKRGSRSNIVYTNILNFVINKKYIKNILWNNIIAAIRIITFLFYTNFIFLKGFFCFRKIISVFSTLWLFIYLFSRLFLLFIFSFISHKISLFTDTQKYTITL